MSTFNDSVESIALPKPFTANQLLETVAEALRRAGPASLAIPMIPLTPPAMPATSGDSMNK